MSQGGRYTDYVPSRNSARALIDNNVAFSSFAGTDIQSFFFGDNLQFIDDEIDSSPYLSDEEKLRLTEDNKTRRREHVSPFGEIQTITISSNRSFGPVRRLGELTPVEYKGGGRTIAGTLVFAVLNRDVFADYLNGVLPGAEDNSWRRPSMMDELPEFNILIRGCNELGSSATGLLVDVKLMSFGTTFSVDDLYTESTYNYVARHYFPFTENWRETLVNSVSLAGSRSPQALSQTFLNDTVMVQTSDGTYYPLDRVMWERVKSLPGRYTKLFIDAGPDEIERLLF